MERLMLTVDEVAQALRVSKSSVYDLMRLKKLGSVKIGRLRRIPVTALEEFVAEQVAKDEGVESVA